MNIFALQDIHDGDEMFWFETTLLLVDSVLHDYSNQNRKTMVSWLLKTKQTTLCVPVPVGQCHVQV